jgi:hypothetical protein
MPASEHFEHFEPRDVQGESIAWRESGSRDADDVVLLLHGLGGSRISWEPQLAELGRRALVAAWDLPGYGASPPLAGPTTFPALADAVATWADELGADLLDTLTLALWGRAITPATVLQPQDRLELLRPLLVDPKEARRMRYRRDGIRPRRKQPRR